MRPMALVGIALAAILIAGVTYLWIGNAAFEHRIEELRLRIDSDQRVGPQVLPRLPTIVRDYALKAGGREAGPALVRAEHAATLVTGVDQPGMAITAEQLTGTRTPGLVWKAHGAMSGLPVTVVDSFADGKGYLSARALGTFQVAGGSGPDYDKGELMRYLSELPVYPDAILNVGSLAWRQLDARTVEVTGQSKTGSASVRFVFDDNGDIAAMQSDDRPMERDGKTIPTPWHGTYSQYRQFGSYRIPSYGEVGWVLADGLFTYWRGEVVSYEPVPSV